MLLKRGKDQHCSGLWSFPGGKLEQYESPLEAARRELKEETGLCGKNWEFAGKCLHNYHDRQLLFYLFRCLCQAPEKIHSEAEYAWVVSGRLSEYPMPEANRKLIPMLLKH